MNTSNTHRGLRVGVLFAAMAQVLWPAPAAAQSLPSGVVSTAANGGGATNISTSGTTMTVTAGNPRTLINWNSFNVANGYTFNVVTGSPNALVVNRVIGGVGASSINGTVASYLGATGGPVGGHVWILNPNGVAVGATGRFDVGGMLLSSLSLADADILDGSSGFHFSGADTGAVTVFNGAQLTARNGGITFLGSSVNLQGGRYDAGSGHVSGIAASDVQMTFDADLRTVSTVWVNQGTQQATAITVTGMPQFSAGRTLLAAAGRIDGQGNVVLGSGGANSISFQNGDVVLYAGSGTDYSGGNGYSVIDGSQLAGGGVGQGGSVTVNGRLTSPGALQILAARGVGNGATALDLRAGGPMSIYSNAGIGTGATAVDLRAGGAIELVGWNGIGNGAADLNLQAGGALTLSGNAYGRDIALQSGGALTAYDLVARDDIVLRSNGSLTTQAIRAGQTVSGLGATDVAGAADTLAGAAQTGYDVDIAAGTGLASITEVRPGAGGDYRIAAGDFTGGGSLTPFLSGLGAFSITDTAGAFTLGFNVTTPGDFTLRTTNGDLNVLSNVASTNGNIALASGGAGAINLSGSLSTGIAAGRRITLDAPGGLVQNGGTITTHTLNASSIGGGLFLNRANLFHAADLTSAGMIDARSDIAGVTFQRAEANGGDVRLAAADGMVLSGSTVRAGSGNVTLDGPVWLLGASTVAATNGGVVINGPVESGDSLVLGSLTVNSTAGATFNGALGGSVRLASLDVNGTATFNSYGVYASGGIALDDASIGAGAGSFSFDAGSGMFTAGAITSPGRSFTVNANGIQATTISAGDLGNAIFRDVVLNAGTGGIQFDGGSASSYTVNGAGALTVTGALETLRLTGSMGGAASLVADNRINAIGPFTSSGLQLRSVGAVRVDGVVDAGAGDLRLVVAGENLQIDATGQLRGRDVSTSSATFFNASGSDGIVAGGEWTVYQTTMNPFATYDGLDSGAHAIWGQTIETLAPSSITGNRYVFAHRPTLTFTTLDTTKTYGTVLGGTPSSHYAISGYMPGVAGAYLADSAANVFSGAPDVTSGGFAERATVAGGPYAISIANGSLSSLSGYQFAFNGTGRVTVDPKAVTGTPTVNTRTYDGTTGGTGSIALTGVLSGDAVTAGGTFTFLDKNAGTGKTVNLTGATLTGADAGNYTLTVPATAIGDILQKAITGTPTTTTKTYDGTANGSGTITLSGVVAGDTVGAGGTFTFVDKNAGTGKQVTLSGVTLSGADAGNYTLTVPSSLLGDILQKAISGTVTVNAKTYDGTTAGTGTVTLAGIVAGDSVSGAATFTFADKNAGAGKTVTVSGASLSGADAGNYTVTLPASALGDILRKALTGTPTVTAKTYDGTTAGSGSIALSGVVAGDAVTAGGTFTYADKNAGTGKTVTVSGATLAGADAGNYTLTVPATVLGDILQKAITGTPVVDAKTYDGTTAATGTITLAGVVAGDSLGATGTFTFADRNAGAGKTVSVGGVALTGADAGNYVVNVPGTAVGEILRRALTGTVTVNTKTYDGTSAGTGTIALSGVVAGDTVGAGGAFTFADRNAGSGKIVAVSGVTLNGADAGNYTISVPASAIGEILRRSITGSVTVGAKTYDGTTAGTGSIALNGVVAGDAVGATGTYTFSDANAGAGKTVSVGGVALTGADAGNYTVVVPGTTVADILRRAITVTANPASKEQGAADPSLGYGLTQGSLVTGDSLTGALARAPGEAPGSYAIGQGTLSASANYQLTFVGSTLTITAAPVDPIAGVGVTDDFGRVVRFLDGGGESAAARARAALEIVDERSPCDPADREAGACETGRPD